MEQEQDQPIINGSLIVCKNNNQAVKLCNNSLCRQNAFVCPDQKCSCHSHETCIMINCQELINAIQKQKQLIHQTNTNSIEAILKIYDTTIEYLSTKRLEFEQSIPFLGLSITCKTFIKSINEADISSIDGIFISELFQQYRNSCSPKALKSKTYFQKRNQSILKQVENVFIELSRNCDLWDLNLNSNIVKKEDQQLILGQFGRASIKFKKLFQASVHNFSGDAFREKCLGIESILTLIQTSEGQKFAAFLQQGWKQPKFTCYSCPTDCQICIQSQRNQEAYIGDSFIYALTDKKVIRCDYLCYSTLGRIQDTIQKMSGPLIGYRKDNRILQICEQCDTTFDNYILPGQIPIPIQYQTFYRPKAQVCKYFQVKDYEVYEVNLE